MGRRAIVSNVGTWMQRTAQDWLVLTELTHRNATAVGIVMGLQFGFPTFISTMAVGVFHAGAEEFGALTSMMAIGSVGGALRAALRDVHRSHS